MAYVLDDNELENIKKETLKEAWDTIEFKYLNSIERLDQQLLKAVKNVLLDYDYKEE